MNNHLYYYYFFKIFLTSSHGTQDKITMFNITKSELYSKFHGFSRHLTCVNAQHL